MLKIKEGTRNFPQLDFQNMKIITGVLYTDQNYFRLGEAMSREKEGGVCVHSGCMRAEGGVMSCQSMETDKIAPSNNKECQEFHKLVQRRKGATSGGSGLQCQLL